MSGLCQSTAYVVDPYREHPELLDVLLKLIKTELNMNMRRLIIRTLGIIGALDPYTYNQVRNWDSLKSPVDSTGLCLLRNDGISLVLKNEMK